MRLTNVIRAGQNLLAGKSLVRISDYYDPRYPPTKFFKKNPDPIYLQGILCGFPRTGTHWIRNVIEHSAGIKTGNLVHKKPAPGAGNVVVKIHARSKPIARAKALWLLPPHKFSGKYVYTFRDPRDAIVSLYEMYKAHKREPGLTQESFLRKHDPVGQYKWEIRAWVLKQHRNVLHVRFEALKADPVEQFARIFRFLEIDGHVSGEILEQRVGQADRGSRPRGQACSWKLVFPQYETLIRETTARLHSEIKELGYELL